MAVQQPTAIKSLRALRGAENACTRCPLYKNATQAVNVNDDRQEYFVGASMPFGPHSLSAMVGSSKTKNVANSRASEFSLGYQYAMSKRTDLYLIGSLINNGSATAYTTSGGTGLGPKTTAGQDVRAVQVGIRHRF